MSDVKKLLKGLEKKYVVNTEEDNIFLIEE